MAVGCFAWHRFGCRRWLLVEEIDGCAAAALDLDPTRAPEAKIFALGRRALGIAGEEIQEILESAKVGLAVA
jgi:hypothetical protein